MTTPSQFSNIANDAQSPLTSTNRYKFTENKNSQNKNPLVLKKPPATEDFLKERTPEEFSTVFVEAPSPQASSPPKPISNTRESSTPPLDQQPTKALVSTKVSSLATDPYNKSLSLAATLPFALPAQDTITAAILAPPQNGRTIPQRLHGTNNQPAGPVTQNSKINITHTNTQPNTLNVRSPQAVQPPSKAELLTATHAQKTEAEASPPVSTGFLLTTTPASTRAPSTLTPTETETITQRAISTQFKPDTSSLSLSEKTTFTPLIGLTVNTAITPPPRKVSPIKETQYTAQHSTVSQQITRAIATVKLQTDRLEVRLDPPELGRIYIDFNLNGEKVVSATLSAEFADTNALLRRHTETLLRELAQAGLNDITLSFNDTPRKENPDTYKETKLQVAANEDNASLPEASDNPTQHGAYINHPDTINLIL